VLQQSLESGRIERLQGFDFVDITSTVEDRAIVESRDSPRIRTVDLDKEYFQQFLNVNGVGRYSQTLQIDGVIKQFQQTRVVLSTCRLRTSSASALP
jgi:hypothetical protein